jgi:hypothetical protein
MGEPLVFSALGAEPSSGIRKRLDPAVAAAPRAHHRRALALELGLRELAHRHGVQRDPCERIELVVGAIDARRRRDALEVRRRGAVTPLAHRRELRVRIAGPRVEVERRIEDEPGADQPARVVPRRVVVVRTQVVGPLVRQPAAAGDLEQADLGAAARVAVADHGDGVAGKQHLVVPRAARVHLGAERVGRRHRLERAAGDADREETPAPQHDEVLAVQLDDSAFVDAGVLDVGDRVGHRFGGRFRRGGRRGRGGRDLAHEALRDREVPAPRLLLAPALHLLGPAPEEVRQLLFAGECGERLPRCSRRVRAGRGGHRGGGERRDRGRQ